MSKIIIFSRTSTTAQDVEQQTKSLIDEAKRLGYSKPNQIVIEYQESATKLDIETRQGINKLKEAVVNDHSIDCMICWELTRIARRADVIYNIRDFLLEHKVRWLVMKPSFMELIDKEGKLTPTMSLMLGIFTSFAESEMMIKAERFKRAKNELRQQGKKFAGAVIFGYMKDEQKNCVPHPVNAKIVQDIYHHYLNTDSSLYDTYNWISTKHPDIFPLAEYKKAQHKIRHLFELEVYYTGNWCYEPLVSEETWKGVHDKMDKARCKARYNCKRDLLCRGKIYCGTCGRMMTGSGGNTKAYFCPTDKLHSCQLNFKVADWLIWERTKDIININGAIDYNAKLKEIEMMINDRIAKISLYINKVNENEKKEAKLLDLYLDGGINKDIYMQKLSQVNQDALELKNHINLLEIEKSELESVLDETQKDLMSPRNINVDSISDFETRLEFVRRYISKMIVTKTEPKKFNITFEYTKPLILSRYWFKVEIHNKKAIIIRVNDDGTEDDISDIYKEESSF